MNHTNSPIDRRTAFKLAGLSASVAAIAAACGGTEGGTDPGRVGEVPPSTELGDFTVDDGVLLRTATSLEQTIVYAYEVILADHLVDDDWKSLIAAATENHKQSVITLQEATVAFGAEAWDCTNPWYMNRFIEPVAEAIDRTGDIAQENVVNTAIALENLASANGQTLAATLTSSSDRSTLAEIGAQAARNAATMTIHQRGQEGYYNPIPGEVSAADNGAILNWAVPWQFGSLEPIELIIVFPDTEGGDEDFVVQTPSLNAYIYNETEPTC